MIEYILENTDGNTFHLNSDNSNIQLRKSWTQGADEFEFDTKIVERSFLPGAAMVGTPRVKERDIKLTFNHVNEDSTRFRTYMNKLITFFGSTIWLIDDTNKMRLSVAPKKVSVEYDDGSLKHSSDNTLTFTALSPLWETSALQSFKYSGKSTIFHFYHENDSAVPCQFEAILETTPVPVAMSYVKLTLESTQEAFATRPIASDIFKFYINGFKGELNTGVVTKLLNNNSFIDTRTGFFLIPPGKQKLIVEFKTKDNVRFENVTLLLYTRPLSWL